MWLRALAVLTPGPPGNSLNSGFQALFQTALWRVSWVGDIRRLLLNSRDYENG